MTEIERDWSRGSTQIWRGKDIQRVDLVGSNLKICAKIARTVLYFFRRGNPTRVLPFRGFILEGPPATGKTEIAKQSAHLVDTQLQTEKVSLFFVDSASIAAPRWGEAEQNLRSVFRRSTESGKLIILFDDIDCLMITRGSVTAQEWHYSINAILLHELDMLDPSRVIVIATTNRSDLVEEAVRSRLNSIKVPPPPIEELVAIGDMMLKDSGVEGEEEKELLGDLRKWLGEIKKPTIRDVQNFVVDKCIDEGLWS